MVKHERGVGASLVVAPGPSFAHNHSTQGDFRTGRPATSFSLAFSDAAPQRALTPSRVDHCQPSLQTTGEC